MGLSHEISYVVLNTDNFCNVVPLIDIILCQCTIRSLTFYVAVIYVPPDISVSDFELFTDLLEITLLGRAALIVGDFNLPQFCSSYSTCNKTRTFHNFCQLMNLDQFNNIMNCNNHILDLVLSNLHSNITLEEDLLPLVPTDAHHPALHICLPFNSEIKVLPFPAANNLRFNFRRANLEQLYQDLLDVDWSVLNVHTDVNLAVNEFYDILYGAVRRSVPYQRSTKHKYPPWFTQSIISKLKLKNYYRRRWKARNCEYYHNEFARMRAICRAELSTAYRSYIQQAEISVRENPKELFAFIHNKKGTTRIPSKLHHDNVVLDTPTSIVEAFAELFSHNQSSNITLYNCEACINTLPFSISLVSEDAVANVMSSFLQKFTAGDDLIPSFLVRDARFALAAPLAFIINLAISTSTFPDAWKRARISPVYKKGDDSVLANYRPVSILSNFAKVFEHFIYSDILRNIQQRLSPFQHGFLSGRSTVTNLVTITQFISEQLDKKKQVDVVYTDLSSAFDTIDHGILLQKLSSFGMCPSSKRLMSSYLCNRMNYVQYNGFVSREFVSHSGIPQGSNLGPLLFLAYINDLLDSFECSVLAYADDIKFYSVIDSRHDIELMQSSLDLFADWCSSNSLKINPRKCCFVSYARGKNVIPSRYVIGGSAIEKCTTFKDLGVLFDSQLTFNPHIYNLCSKASRTLGFVMRTSAYFTDCATLKALYFAFIVSTLEYAAVVWSPHYITHQLAIERIQRKFLKFLSFKIDGVYPCRGIDYDQLLERHNFHSLTKRREHHGARFIFKLAHGHFDTPNLLAIVNFHVPRVSARCPVTFALPTPHTNNFRNAPINRCLRIGNLYFDDIFVAHL